MNQDVYDSLKVRARQALLAERMKTSAELQVGHMKKDGVPELALVLMEDGIGLWRRAADSFKRESKKICKGEPIYQFVDETVGLSTACFVLLGCLPPLMGFANPAKVWKYCGLHVTRDGRGPTGADLAALKKENPEAGWSPVMRAHAIKRLAEPCMKMKGGEDKNGRPLAHSPFRRVYDSRYLRTQLTHPSMLDEGDGCEFCDACYEKRRKTGKTGLDCANIVIDGKRGHHWKDAHRHADALRVTAKAILLDLWLVDNGKEAVVGGHPSVEVQVHDAPSTDIGDVSDAATEDLETKEQVRASGA